MPLPRSIIGRIFRWVTSNGSWSAVGLGDTSTFGRVAAKTIRQRLGDLLNVGPDSERNPPTTQYMLIQTDAQITHGNSGGALYVRRGRNWGLVGLPTFIIGEGELQFAFATDELERSEWQWFSAGY